MQNNTKQSIEQVVNDLTSCTDDEEKASKLLQLCQICGQFGETQLLDAVLQLSYLEVDMSVKVRQRWCAFMVQASISVKNQVMLQLARDCCVRHFEDEDKLVAHCALHSAGLLVVAAAQIILQAKDSEVRKEMKEMVNDLINKLLTVAEDPSKLATAIHALEECKQVAITLTAPHIIVFNQCVGSMWKYTGGNSVNLSKELNSILMRICSLLKRPNACPQVSLTLIRVLCEMAQQNPTQYANQVVPCLLDYTIGSSVLHQNSIVSSSLKRQLKEGIISLLKNRDPVLKSWSKDLVEVMNRFQCKSDADAAIRYRKKKEYREQQQLLQQGSKKKKAEDGLVKEQRKSKQPRLDKKQGGSSSVNVTSLPSQHNISNGQPTLITQQQGQDGEQSNFGEEGVEVAQQHEQIKSGDSQQPAQVVESFTPAYANQPDQIITPTSPSVINQFQNVQSTDQSICQQQEQQQYMCESENEKREMEENGDQSQDIVESDPLHAQQDGEVELDDATRYELEKMRQAAREEIQRQRRFQMQKLQNSPGQHHQSPPFTQHPRLNQQLPVTNSEKFSKQNKSKARDLNQKIARKLQKKLKGEELTTEDESDRNEYDYDKNGVFQNDFAPQQIPIQQQIPFQAAAAFQPPPPQHMLDFHAGINQQFGMSPAAAPFIKQTEFFFAGGNQDSYFVSLSVGEVMQQLFGFMEGVDQSNIHMDIFDVVPDLTLLVNSMNVDVAADIVLDLLKSLPNNEERVGAQQEMVEMQPMLDEKAMPFPIIPQLEDTMKMPPPPPPPLPLKKKQLTQKDEFKIRALTIRSKKATKFHLDRKKQMLGNQLTTVLSGQWSTLERCWQRLQNQDEIVKKITRNSVNALEKKKDSQTIQKIIYSLNSIVAGLAINKPEYTLNLVVYQNCLSDILNWMANFIQPSNYNHNSNPMYVLLSNLNIVPFHQIPDFFNKVLEQHDWVEVVLLIADNLIKERWPQSQSMLDWILEVTAHSNVKMRQEAIQISVKLYQSCQKQSNGDEDDSSIVKLTKSAAKLGLEQVIGMQSSVQMENDKIKLQDLLEVGRLMHLYVDLASNDASLLHLLFQYFAQASELGRKLILQGRINEEKVALDVLLQNVKQQSELVQVVQNFTEGSEELAEHIGLTLSDPGVEPIIPQDLALTYWNHYLQHQQPKWTIPTVAYLSEVLVQRDRESWLELVKKWTSLDQYRFNLLLQRLYSNLSRTPNPNPNSHQQTWVISPQDLIFDLIMISNDPQFQPLSKVTQSVLMCLSNFKTVFNESVLANVLHRIVYRNERPTLLMWLTMHVFQNFPNLRRTIQNDYVRKLMNEPRVQLNVVLWRGVLLFHLNNQLFDELLSMHDALFQSHVWDWRMDGSNKEKRDTQNLRNQLLQYLESHPKIVQLLSLAKKRIVGWQDNT